MAHKYVKYLDNFHRIVQLEKDIQATAKPIPPDQQEIVLDDDATEEEVQYWLNKVTDRDE